jgi:hypothetical protein
LSAVPCCESALMACTKYKTSLQLEDTARKLYKMKIDAMAAKLRDFVGKCQEATVDIEDSLSKEINVDRLMQLASWSATPQFDRSALQLFKGALFLIANKVAVANTCASGVSLKTMPHIVCEAYAAGKAVVHCGADVAIPKMSFLSGSAEVADTMYKMCAETSQKADHSVNSLTHAIQVLLTGSIDVVAKTLYEDIAEGPEFLAKFDMAKCEAANKQIGSALGKAELIKQKCDVAGLQVGPAEKARDKARAAINRYAIAQLMSRPNFEHPTKGKALRNQLQIVWETCEKHTLDILLPDAMQEALKEFAIKFGKEKAGVAQAEAEPTPAAKRARKS